MSSSDEQNSDDESQQNDSSEESATESEEESDDDIKETEKAEKLPYPIVSKPSLVPTAKIAPSNAVKSKTYDQMVYEAMKNLNENRRIGVSIQRIMKYMRENHELPPKKIKFFLKKTIDKGLKENIYVHTSGTGLLGSIAFSTAHWNDLKKEEKKELKAVERKAAPKPAVKRKPGPKQKAMPISKPAKKLKVDPKTKKSQSVEDKNNNVTVGKTGAKKANVASNLLKGLPKTKPKPELKSTINKDKASGKITKTVVPSAKSKPPDRAARSKL